MSELIVDVNQLPTGLNCRIFDQRCEGYDNLVALLSRPGFRTLDLAFIVRGREKKGRPSLRSGLLRQALTKARDLQHFSFRTTVNPDTLLDGTVPGSAGSIDHLIPLQTIFPVENWSNLRHFGLSRFLVVQDDVISLLAALPKTLRSVELSFLKFLDNGGNYHGLLAGIRETLRWHERDVDTRPKVIIGIGLVPPRAGLGIWVENEAQDFLYGDAPNPFIAESADGLLAGVGVERDTFEPEHERPNADLTTLARLGYCKEVFLHI